MRYLALATDYDGTLAISGALDPAAAAALEKVRVSGRRVVLLTSRTLDELASVCPELDRFDIVVSENGGVMYAPSGRQTTVLSRSVAPELAQNLALRGIGEIVNGQVMLGTARPHEIALLEAIRDLGIDAQIIFNGRRVLALPSGVNKGTGLEAALRELGLSPHEVVGVGSAENDHAFLEMCECAVAVDNAIASVKARVDFCTSASAGAGVAELASELVETDLAARTPGGVGDAIVLAERSDGRPALFPPYAHNILVCGPSGAGKSTFATGLIERLSARHYQLCIIDPEGDFGTLDDVVAVGNRMHPPTVDDVLERLRDPKANVVANLLGIALRERPHFFSQLFPGLQAMRARTGRPHWILIDEAHHLLPASWGLARSLLPQRLGETILITYRPSEVAPAMLALVDTAVVVGPAPARTLADLAAALGESAPPVLSHLDNVGGRIGEVMIWQRTAARDPFRATVIPARSQRLRHLRKYAEGDLGPRSFFFRGHDQRMNLRAQNLVAFCEIGAGVDDATWTHHLRRGDYSTWLRRVIKDEDLAMEVAGVEKAQHLTSTESRRHIRDAIDRRYMLPN